MKNSRSKFRSFILRAVLNSLMKSCMAPLCLVWDVDYPFIQHLHAKCILPVSHLVAVLDQLAVLQCLYSSHPFLMAPKCKSGDAGNLNMPKRSHKVLLLNENVHMYREKLCVYRIRYCRFSRPLGVLDALWIRGHYCII